MQKSFPMDKWEKALRSLKYIQNLLTESRNFDLTFLAQIRNYFALIAEKMQTIEMELTKSKDSDLHSIQLKKELNEPTLIMENELRDLMNSMDHDLHALKTAMYHRHIIK